MKRVNLIILAGMLILTGFSALLNPIGVGISGEIVQRHAAQSMVAPKVPLARLGSNQFVHHDRLDSLSFSPDGSLLFAVSSDEGCLWDLTTGKKRHAFRLKSSIMCGALSQDGRTVVLAQNGSQVHVFNATTGRHTTELTGAVHRACAVAVTPDGQLAASGDGMDVILWDLDGNKELRRWKQKGDYVGALQFSPDGGRLAVASSQGTISIHDLTGGKAPVKIVGEPGHRNWLTFSPNGKMVAGSWQRTSGGSQSSFRIWDATTGKVLHNIPGSFFASAFSPDGRTFAVSGFDARAFSPDGGTFAVSGLETTCIYDTATGKEVQRLPDCHQHILALAFSPDGKMLATGQGQHIRLWNTENWQEVSAESDHAGPVQAIAFSPDGRTIATGGLDGRLILWTWPEAQERQRIENVGSNRGVQHLTFSPDSRTVAATAWINHNDMFFLFNAATGAQITKFGKNHTGKSPVVFLPHGKQMLTGQSDGSLALWDAVSGKLIRTVGSHKGGIHALQPVPDGDSVWWAGEYQGLGLRNLKTGEDEYVLSGGRHHVRAHFAVSANGDWLAVGNRVWDIKTRKVIAEGRDSASAISPDGRILATTKDGGIVFWEALTRQETHHILPTGMGTINALAFSPDGTVLAAAGYGEARVWDMTGILQNGHLPEIDLTSPEMKLLWQELGSDDASAAHRAAWRLAAGGRTAVKFLSERLRPAPTLDPDKIRVLRERFTDPDYDTRDLAAHQLVDMGIELRPDEREALRRPDPLNSIGRTIFLPPPVLLPLPPRVRSSRAVAALEHSGTAAAESLLYTLTKGAPTAPLTLEAKVALARMQQRSGSAELRHD